MEEQEEEVIIVLAPPSGLNLFPSLRPPLKTLTFHRISVLLIIFLAYASFHASRKPPSIVKSVLGPQIRSQNATSSLIDDGLKNDLNFKKLEYFQIWLRGKRLRGKREIDASGKNEAARSWIRKGFVAMEAGKPISKRNKKSNSTGY